MKIIDRILKVAILITLLGVCVFLYKGYNTPKYDNSIIERKLDSLNNKRDSISFDIHNTDTAIYNNKTIYVKERNNIIKQSSDSDMLFFTNYIREVGRKLLIDTISIKDN